jgi:heme-degrading monooxygenase HmoA
MVARTWRGSVRRDDDEKYWDYLRRTGVRDLRSTPGNRGVYVLRRVEGGRAHFMIISLWRSRADIRSFAGDDIERARYYPEDEDFLLELEPTVTHHEVLTGHEMTSTVVPKERDS